MVYSGSVYEVQESGLELIHGLGKDEEPKPSNPEAFLENFRTNFQMRVLERPSENHLVLEFINADASFVNALRRILLAEVPTVALEHVYMWNNTSMIHDEVLAHRLGLIPLQLDARFLDEPEEDDSPTDRNTVVFRLAVTCEKPNSKKGKNKKGENDNNDNKPMLNQDVVERNPDLEKAAATAAAKSADPAAPTRPYTTHVYSRDLVWVPQGDQENRFENIRPVHDDILIAKLRPGQAIELEAHGRRGVGKDHAKFSPVATASYRLTPRVEILEPIYDDLAEELVHLYEPGVFKLVPVTDQDVGAPPGAKVKAQVCNPYASSMSRNYMRNPQLAKSLRITRIPDRFIFSVESVGMQSPAVLIAEALRVLQGKCRKLKDLADQSMMQS